MSKKGQMLSVDLAASILVFALVLVFLYQAWDSNVDSWEQQRNSLELEEKAVQQAKNLIESPGFPANWTLADVSIIGLAVQPNVLSKEKISFFSGMDYNVAREKMNIMNFNFLVEIFSESPELNRTIGVQPCPECRIATIENNILIEGKNAVFRFKLFR